ncbi:MAG: hypothetical protein AAB366_03220 [Patescibacteria group bacterium]
MKRLLMFGICLCFFIVGCATGPQTQSEAFLNYNQNPKIGKVVNRGTTHLEIWIKDEARRIVEHNYMAGANFLKINNQHIPKYYVWELEFGRYEIEFVPFYYETSIGNLLFGKPIRTPRKLQKRTFYFYVDKNPTDYYDYETGDYFGWGIDLNGGDIPNAARGLPGINLQFQGEAWRLLQ